MFVVSVEFEIHPDQVAAFREAVLKQAANSLRHETACAQFDVAQDPNQPTRFYLYELYDDAKAFEAHRQTAHFAQFSSTVGSMIANKNLQTWEMISPPVAKR